MHLKSIVLILLTSVVAAENGICYLKDLQKAENIAPVTPNITLSGDHLKVICEEGYTTRTVIPLCIHGIWNRNTISPCKEMTCNKPPPKVTNAVEEVRYRHRAVVIYRCKEPYILEGPSQVECLFGEWRGQLPICAAKNCTDAPPNVIHATVEIISTSQNKLAKYACKEPYLLVGNSEIRCLLGEWNGTAPMCTDSRCYINDLQTGENLAEGTPMTTNSGEKLNATCKVGYTLDEERPVCQNGTWIKNSFSICKESTCSIPNIDHGEVLEEYKGEYYFNLTKLQNDRNIMHIKMPIGRIVSPGTSYTLLCYKGHVVQGKSVHKSDISCKAGIWLPEPVCVFEMMCRKLNETNLLSIYYTDDRKIGSFAFFQCLHPGKRIDEPFARCLGNGLWSKSAPTCESKCEEEPPPIQNGRIESFDRNQGSEVRYRCDENFEILGDSSVICNRGKWEGDPPQCQEIEQNEIGPVRQNNLDREKHSSTTEAPSTSSPSVTTDTCYCTYDYPTNIAGYSGNRPVFGKNGIGKGETVTLYCVYGEMFIVWNNGVAFYEEPAVTLTCDTCINWSPSDLPQCEYREPGDSFLTFSNDMKILPGGIIEIPRHTNVSFDCISLLQMPAWYPNDINGTYVSETWYDSTYTTSLQIIDASDSHAGRYNCYTLIRENGYNTTLVLKIAEVTCEKPLPLEGGSVQFSDGQAVGSIATYLCEEGTTLVGVPSSKCLENGVWTFDSPKCLRSCIIPEIENGVIGFYKTVQKYRRTYQRFEQFQVGETVKPGESVNLRCQHGFIPVNIATLRNGDAENIWCREGVWSKSMQCAPSKCLEEPPKMENGYPVIENSTNGSAVWYKCENGFEKLKAGHVECVYGTWKGYTPVCGNNRCYTNSLNYPGLKLPNAEYFENYESFDIRCEEGYRKTLSKNRISCFRGRWKIESNPCLITDQIGQIHNLEIRPIQQNNFDREKHSSTTEAPSTSSPSVTTDTCYCTYDYPTDIVAYSGKRPVDGKSVIWKGETVSLSCRNRHKHIVWNNGLAFDRRPAVTLTCDTCKNWSRSDLPFCRIREPVDSFLVFSKDMKILPGGIIEISRHTVVVFQCINFLRMPEWYPDDISGTYINLLKHDYILRTELHILDATDSHARTYDCFARIGNRSDQIYRPTTLVLKIAVPMCSLASLFLPEDVSADLRNVTGEYVPYGAELQLVCNSGSFLSGGSKTKCGEQGRWEHGNVRCIQACILGETKSQLLVEPLKDHYLLDESITFSCPPGKHLSSETQRVMCLGTSWSHPIPDCVSLLGIQSCSLKRRTEKLLIYPFKDHYIFGEAITLSCPFGHKLSSEVERVMCLGTSWSDSIPDCVKVI